MPEAEGSGVEALAGLAQFRLFVAIDRITQDRVTDVGHMDPTLMGPSCLQAAADMGVAPKPLHHLPMGDGGLGIPLGDAHFFPVRGMPANGGIHGAAVLPEGAADDGLVSPRHGVVLQLGGKHRVGQGRR